MTNLEEIRPSRTHECVFVEEAEPSGRLVLPACLGCGLTAMDALLQLREALDASEGERDDLDTGAGMLLGENVELTAALRESREANAGLLRERNTWARQMADALGAAEDAKAEAEKAWDRAREIDSDRDDLTLKLEDAVAEVEQLRLTNRRLAGSPAPGGVA